MTSGALFSEIASFIRLIAAREAGCTENVVEATLLRLENYVHILNAIIATISSNRCGSSTTFIPVRAWSSKVCPKESNLLSCVNFIFLGRDNIHQAFNLEVGFVAFTAIPDSDLCAAIDQIVVSMPHVGQRLVRGLLLAQGINVLQHKLENVLPRLTPSMLHCDGQYPHQEELTVSLMQTPCGILMATTSL